MHTGIHVHIDAHMLTYMHAEPHTQMLKHWELSGPRRGLCLCESALSCPVRPAKPGQGPWAMPLFMKSAPSVCGRFCSNPMSPIHFHRTFWKHSQLCLHRNSEASTSEPWSGKADRTLGMGNGATWPSLWKWKKSWDSGLSTHC